MSPTSQSGFETQQPYLKGTDESKPSLEKNGKKKSQKRKEKKRDNTCVAIVVVVGMMMMFIGVLIMILFIPTDPEPEKPLQPQQPAAPEKTYLVLYDEEPVLTDYVSSFEPELSDYIIQPILDVEPAIDDYNYDSDSTEMDVSNYNDSVEAYIYGDTHNATSGSDYQYTAFTDSSTLELLDERVYLNNLPASGDEVYVYTELYDFLEAYKDWKENNYDPALKTYENAHEYWMLQTLHYQDDHDTWEEEYNEVYEQWLLKYQVWLEHEYKHWNEVEYPLWEQEYEKWQNESMLWEEKHQNEEKKIAQKYQYGMLIYDVGAIISSTLLMFAGLTFKMEDIGLRKAMIGAGTAIVVVMFAIPLGFSYLLSV